MVKHRPVNVENNALWLICMYTYLRNIGPPFFHGVFLFSKVWVLIANFDSLFALAYSSHILWSWPLGRVWYHHTFLSSNLYLKSHQFCQHFVFLERESWSQSYYVFLDCPPAWSCPTSVQIGFYLGMRLCDKRFDKELFSCINFGLSKLFQTQKSFRHRFKANSLWRNSRDSYRHVFRSDKNFCFAFGENMKWYFVG